MGNSEGAKSDHPSGSAQQSNDGGPAWVANVVNGVSDSSCVDQVNGARAPYWADTAIVVTRDDWGGFYDHVLPPFLSEPTQGQGDYQLGFRVPLIFISAYTQPIIDSVNQYDFGSILRFVNGNFGIQEGALGFADQRSSTNLRAFYNFLRPPKKFCDSHDGAGVVLFERYAARPNHRTTIEGRGPGPIPPLSEARMKQSAAVAGLLHRVRVLSLGNSGQKTKQSVMDQSWMSW